MLAGHEAKQTPVQMQKKREMVNDRERATVSFLQGDKVSIIIQSLSRFFLLFIYFFHFDSQRLGLFARSTWHKMSR